ncbi:MAG: hypothetical protein PWP63_1627 [Methanolobus sp.]|nr:hypothetical protein [Methanolobus sp.]
MKIDKIQELQNEEYWFPYHYISHFEGTFTQYFNDI